MKPEIQEFLKPIYERLVFLTELVEKVSSVDLACITLQEWLFVVLMICLGIILFISNVTKY